MRATNATGHSVLVAMWLSAACEAGEGGTTDPGPDEGPDAEPIELPDLDVRYRTQYIDVATFSDDPICAGTLALMDAHVENLLGVLGLVLSRRLRLFHLHPEEPAPEEWCDDWFMNGASGSTGCYIPNDAIFTRNSSLPHEIVHAVTAEVGGSWWIEGVAEAFSNGFPSPTFAAGWSDFTRSRGYGLAHLVRWIVERYGGPAFMELYARTPLRADEATVDEAVREVLGVGFGELMNEYAVESAFVYPSHWLCYIPPGAPEPPWDGDYWEHEVTFDCDAPSTFSDSDFEHKRMTVRIPVTLPRTAPYRFLADHSDAELSLQPCLPEPIMDPMVDTSAWPHPFDSSISDGTSIEAGPYVLFVSLPQGAPTTVRLVGYPSIH
ncbi:hypothetical protein [Nannocystis sp. SCPEA4]|uniref:hypothetical protein n=1 Tax=Nannocystis sp. SCPEA4 TaxID=2996787 RepID=UPI00226F5817|nr:hypothetical protein [Nannocystis sp. SCPEA4]MCY1053913.1 hypothetical protein [Nannocystis sp. SCPEA4]